MQIQRSFATNLPRERGLNAMCKFLAAIMSLLCCAGVEAADRNATSCTLPDVTGAYNIAADGDRVLIPAGSCTWDGALTIAKALQIVGAGAGTTTIAGARFNVTVPDGKAWRVAGLTATGTAGFNITGHSKAGRIDHITFSGVSGYTQNRVIWVNPAAGGYSAGLIDHVTMADSRSINIHIREDWGGGNQSYMRPLGLGGADAWYVEDSVFAQSAAAYNTSAPVTDCDGGGRLVFRFNTVDGNYLEMHDAIVSGLRSCRKWEIYNNNWITTSSKLSSTGQFAQIAIRGGTGVVFNNTFLASTGFDIIFSNYRSGGQTAGQPWVSTCQNSGSGKACLNIAGTAPRSCAADADCGGVAGSCIKIDGSGSNLANYPCRDQMGTDSNSPQQILPALFWNNNVGRTSVRPSQEAFADSRYLAEGRDYCIGPTTSLDDDAIQPISCAGRNVQYSQFTFPHPLQVGVIPLQPPTNLIVK